MVQRPPNKANAENGGIPEMGFLRLGTILNIYPVSKSTWWAMVKAGTAPKPVKLSRRCAAWRAADIRALIEAKN